jgi:hypothetical protein
MKSLIQKIKQAEQKKIEAHMPAKDAQVLTDDERSDLDRFIEAYDQQYVLSRDTDREVESDGFHPSALGIKSGKCGRRDVYLLRGVRKKADFQPRVLRIFAVGHATHARIQSILPLVEGLEFENEVEIKYDDPPIRGHADGVITWEGNRILLEIKSIGDVGFAGRIKWKKAKPEHFAQANIYAYILGLDWIFIMYENKNDQDFKVFKVKADPVAAEKQIAKWKKTYDIHLKGELPQRPYKPTSEACMSCDLREHCLADSEMGV